MQSIYIEKRIGKMMIIKSIVRIRKTENKLENLIQEASRKDILDVCLHCSSIGLHCMRQTGIQRAEEQAA